MALKNSALSAASKARGDKITTSIYDDLAKLLANDNGLDTDIQGTLSKQPTVINCMNGCALGCSSACSSTCGNSCTDTCDNGCNDTCTKRCSSCGKTCAGTCARNCRMADYSSA